MTHTHNIIIVDIVRVTEDVLGDELQVNGATEEMKGAKEKTFNRKTVCQITQFIYKRYLIG